MYICICRQVTDKEVHQAISDGATTLRELCEMLPLGAQCGRCCASAESIIQERTQSPCSLSFAQEKAG